MHYMVHNHTGVSIGCGATPLLAEWKVKGVILVNNMAHEGLINITNSLGCNIGECDGEPPPLTASVVRPLEKGRRRGRREVIVK